MPKFYFNIFDDLNFIDDEGEDCADVNAALAHATGIARHLAVQTVWLGHLTTSHRVEIVDNNREVIDSVTVGDAVEIRT